MVNDNEKETGIKDSLFVWANDYGKKYGIEGNKKYGPPGHHDDLDAFRHAFCHCVVATFTQTKIYSWVIGHLMEIEVLGGNSAMPCPKAMDLYNNKVGRSLIIRREQVQRLAIKGDDVVDFLAQKVADAVKNGKTINDLADERMPSSCQIKYGKKDVYNKKQSKKTGKYIWRTEGDGEVRMSHQLRDGKVFEWDNPPEGGHPGEDYGCRCVAEDIDEEGISNKEIASIWER